MWLGRLAIVALIAWLVFILSMQFLAPTRPPFLLLAPACVAPGLAAAAVSGPLSPLLVALVVLAALAAHISVNAFNEVADFENGLDLTTQRTPFSGGSGAIPANPALLGTARAIAWLALAACLGIGAVFVRLRGWPMLALGGLGLAVLVTYSSQLVRRPLLCLVAPGLGFGAVMVIGSSHAINGSWSAQAGWAALLVFFLVNNLLLLNQLPDMQADRGVGRSNLPLRWGLRATAVTYASMLLAALTALLVAVFSGVLPRSCLIAVLPMLPALPIAVVIWGWNGSVPVLMPWLAVNVVASLVTPILLAAGLAWPLFG